MENITLKTPDKKDVGWAIKKEFEFLPDVDIAFSPENMGFFRKFLLKNIVLPGSYLNKMRGQIVSDEERKIGYIFTKSKSASIQIESIGILQNDRRKAFGKRLINWTENIAKENEKMYLSARVTPENLGAIQFFGSLGFKPFQPDFLRSESVSFSNENEVAGEIKEVPPTELLALYEKWSEVSLEQGDLWAAPIILADYPRMSLRTTARHWSCHDGDTEIGYLRIAGLVGKLDIYLILDQAYWESEIAIGMINSALKSYPKISGNIRLSFGSSEHLNRSKNLFSKLGFNLETKPRYLMVKKLAD